MKRVFGVLMCLVLLSAAASPAWAQGYRGRNWGRASTYRGYDDWQRREAYGRRYDRRSFWERHRDKLTVAGGAGAGAAIGAMTGGKKGAIIGGLLGAGASALYTYRLRDRNNRRYYRRW